MRTRRESVGRTSSPAAGDLFAFGVMGSESSVCRVRAIRPSGNFAATLELVDDAPQIHQGDTAPVPGFKPTTPAPVDPFNYPPVNLGAVPFEELVEGGLIASVRLSWSPPPQPGVVAYLYQYRSGDGEWSRIYRVSGQKATVRDVPAGPFEFRVKAEYDSGAISTWSRRYVVEVPDPNRTPANEIVSIVDIEDDTKDIFKDIRNDLDAIFARMDLLGAAAGTTLGEQTLKALELDVATGRLSAEVRREETERIEGDQAIARTVETVRATTEETGAAVRREAEARAEGDEANARLAEAARAAADEADAAVLREAQARADGDRANARLAETAQAKADDVDAAVRREAQARADGDRANAEIANAARAQARDALAGGAFRLQARASRGSSTARFSVLVKAGVGDQYIDSGMVIEVTGSRRSQRSRVAFLAERFTISDGTSQTVPFSFQTRPQQIGGVTVPAGLYLKQALIRYASIDTLLIRENAVTVPASARGNLVAGTGWANFSHLVSSAINLNIASPVLVLWAIEQGYGRGAGHWSFRLRVNGVVHFERQYMGATNDYPSGQFIINRPAGLTTVALDWGGTEDKIDARGSLTLLGIQR